MLNIEKIINNEKLKIAKQYKNMHSNKVKLQRA